MRSWIATACEPSVTRRALKVAAIVGSLLALINHGDALLAGTVTWQRWVQIGLTFLVPYCVSTFASVETIRHLPARAGKAGASDPVRRKRNID